jgi:hypothetical protein
MYTENVRKPILMKIAKLSLNKMKWNRGKELHMHKIPTNKSTQISIRGIIRKKAQNIRKHIL